jgi:zinc protease
VVVGDKARILDGLKRLGYDIVELDKDGKPVAEQNATEVEVPASTGENALPVESQEKGKKKKKRNKRKQ